MHIQNINILKSHLMHLVLSQSYPIRFDMERWAFRQADADSPYEIFKEAAVHRYHIWGTPDYVTECSACLATHALIAGGHLTSVESQAEIELSSAKWLGFTQHEVHRLFFTENWEKQFRSRYETGTEIDRIIAALDQLDWLCREISTELAEQVNNHEMMRRYGSIPTRRLK